MIKIESGIPMPKERKRRSGRNDYPFEEMEIGQSFFLPDVPKNFQIYSTIRDYNLRNHNKQIKVVQKREGNGVRIWRIE